MKKWIVEQFIAFFEITGMRVPGWVRKLVSEETYALLLNREQELTRSLRGDDPEEATLPDELRERLDAAIGREEATAVFPRRKTVSFTAWGFAAAAIIVIGISFFYFLPQGGVMVQQEENVVAAIEAEPDDADPIEGEELSLVATLNREVLASDMLLEPLVEEQARLASDMTSALQFFAESVLPAEYARQVNNNLETLEKRITKSI